MELLEDAIKEKLYLQDQCWGKIGSLSSPKTEKAWTLKCKGFQNSNEEELAQTWYFPGSNTCG